MYARAGATQLSRLIRCRGEQESSVALPIAGGQHAHILQADRIILHYS